MKISAALVALATIVVLFQDSSAKSYKNHKVVTFTIEDETQLKEVQSLQSFSGFDFMDPPEFVPSKLQLVMSPELFPVFEEIAIVNKIDYTITSHDLQASIDSERPKKQRKDVTFDDYNTLEEIHSFLDETEANYPDRATVFTVGQSFEGRLIKGIKITTNEKNPAVFLEATIHAREWITAATSVWMIREILNPQNLALKELIESVTWYFVPVLNVDGYVYTWETDRLWRKTRSVHNILCRGVDANRNFGFNWKQGGSSNLACDQTYAGPSAFSEVEAVALMNYFERVASKTDAYFCLHSAAKLLMYPLGNTNSTENVPNIAHLKEIGEAAGAALEAVHGTVYRVGNAMDTLYVTSGSSRDHAYGHFEIPLVFTYEMREGPENIFVLPKEEIVPNSEEIFISILTVISKGRELGYFQQKP